MTLSLSLLIIALLFVNLRISGAGTRANPLHGFMFFNTIMAIGILFQLNANIDADFVHAWLLLSTALGFLIGGYLSFGDTKAANLAAKKFFASKVDYRISGASAMVLFVIIVVSLAVSALFFYRIGYLLFVDAISDFITGRETNDFATRRLAAHAGSGQYMAAGYVNQFKNFLLPMCVGILIAYQYNCRSKINPFLLLAIPVSAVLLLGTGQKGALVQMGVVCFFIYGILRWRHKIPFNALIAAGALGLLYVFATILQGRASFAFSIDALRENFEQVAYRILGANQEGAVIGFRFIYGEPIVWGSEWLDGFLGILPGNEGSSLSHTIYELMFFTDRGTAPASLWGSATYNFGILGAIVVSVLFGFLCGHLYRRMLNGRRTLIRCFCYAYVFAHLSMWIAAGPAQLVNNGIVSIAILREILRRTEGNLHSTARTNGFRRLDGA